MRIRTKKDVTALVARALETHVTWASSTEREALAGYVFQALEEVVVAVLRRGDELRIPGLGTLKPRRRKARTITRNGLGVSGSVPARTAVGFAAHERLKKRLNAAD